MSRELIIIGASARAAAESAVRAGFAPYTADLFADTDLQAIALHAIRCPIEEYPGCFFGVLETAPQAPWMFTGALENAPVLVNELAQLRPLWGCGIVALTFARNPTYVARQLSSNRLPVLQTCSAIKYIAPRRSWLRKPFRGAAGQGVAFADEPTGEHPQFYWQEFKPGTPMSAVFVSICQEVKLLGVTEQLIGVDWLNSSGFGYCGNIGPIALADKARTVVEQIGIVVGGCCMLQGIFGIDFILADGIPWLVEVNPRYTASVEVLELATGVSAIAEHAGVFGADCTPMATTWGQVVGKAILYAERCFGFPGVRTDCGKDVRYADVPAIGEVIESGWPILTILVAADSVEECRRRLLAEATSLKRFFAG